MAGMTSLPEQKHVPEGNGMGMAPYLDVKILLIDDDREFCSLMNDFMAANSFTVTAVHSGQEGLRELESGGHTLVLLDVFLPDINGIDVLKLIRQKSTVPVVMLSAHNEETDRIIALEVGADDYVPKTFSARELLARVRAVLRRHALPFSEAGSASGDREDDDTLCFRDLVICNRAKEVRQGGRPVSLTASEFQILYTLAREAGKVFSREDLLAVIADRNFTRFDRSIDVHISSLRHKLGDTSSSPKYIRTFRGLGYAFIR